MLNKLADDFTWPVFQGVCVCMFRGFILQTLVVQPVVIWVPLAFLWSSDIIKALSSTHTSAAYLTVFYVSVHSVKIGQFWLAEQQFELLIPGAPHHIESHLNPLVTLHQRHPRLQYIYKCSNWINCFFYVMAYPMRVLFISVALNVSILSSQACEWRRRVWCSLQGAALDQDLHQNGLCSRQSCWLPSAGALRADPLPIQPVPDRRQSACRFLLPPVYLFYQFNRTRLVFIWVHIFWEVLHLIDMLLSCYDIYHRQHKAISLIWNEMWIFYYFIFLRN